MTDRGFITPPPGLLPEPEERAAAPAAAPAPSVPVFFPAPPGVAAAPAREETVTAEEDADAARTPAAPVETPAGIPQPLPAAESSRVLVLPDGTAHPLSPALYVGRSPSTAGESGAHLLALPAEGTLSKTHAVLRSDRFGITVEDLHSTNGTAVLDENGDPRLLEPGVPVPVPTDATIRLGDVRIAIRRA